MKRAVALEHRHSGGWNRTSTNQRMKLVAYQWPTPAALPRGVEPRRAAFARQPPDPRARARASASAGELAVPEGIEPSKPRSKRSGRNPAAGPEQLHPQQESSLPR